jgi:hypothetical protein
VNLLDGVADWIRKAVAFLSPSVVDYVWFPALVTVVFIAAMLLVRRLLPLLGRLGAALLPLLAAVAGATLLAPDMLIATTCRWVHRHPPAVLYHYGDAVAASVIRIARTSTAVADGLGRLARLHVFLVMLGCVALIWTWNHDYCSADPAATTCVRPFTSWVDTLGDGDPVPPAP